LELSETHGRQIGDGGIALELSLSQQELAEWVEASREAVAKALRRLRESGG
jgi:CRP/FNR family transcriptional regulator, cyclic AMP receptor protein